MSSLCTTVPVMPVIALLRKDRRTVRFPASPPFIDDQNLLCCFALQSVFRITLSKIIFANGDQSAVVDFYDCYQFTSFFVWGFIGVGNC